MADLLDGGHPISRALLVKAAEAVQATVPADALCSAALLPPLRFMQRALGLPAEDMGAIMRGAGMGPLVLALTDINFSLMMDHHEEGGAAMMEHGH